MEMNKKELIQQMQEVGHRIGTNAVKDHLDSYGISIEGVELGFYVKDTSKVKWKTNAKFTKLFDSGLNKIMTKNIFTVEMVGLLTILTAYLSYEDNSLINKDGSYLNHNDIMELTGWSKKKVNQILTVLIENELIHTEKQIEDKRKNKYFINPNLFYKGQKIESSVKEFYKDKKNKKD